MAATVAVVPENRVILYDVSWDLYERLLAEQVNRTGTRFAYDRGALEIMVVYQGHEDFNRTLAALVEAVAMAKEQDYCRGGSTTFKSEELLKGVEPDSCFYFRDAELVREKAEIDLKIDPPPELVIEVDIGSSSLSRFPIFAALGFREVWRYHNGRVTFFELRSGEYVPIEASVVLPPMTANTATRFLEESRRMKPHEWFRAIQLWTTAALKKS